MTVSHPALRRLLPALLSALLPLFLALAGCQTSGPPYEANERTAAPAPVDDAGETDHEHDEESGPAPLELPALQPAALADGQKLRVVATTGVIGDVAARVGREAIDLTVLMAPGQDPHSYQPGTGDLTQVAGAHVVLVNGWQLEEGLVNDLANVAREAPIVPVSANVTPLPFGQDDHEGQGDGGDRVHAADPHVWLDPHLVQQWVENIERVFGALDPANSALYETNAAAYREELTRLTDYMKEQLAQIPADRRKLVTNHDSLAYFARRFEFQIVGTVIPAPSTLAEPSARDLVTLIQQMEAAGVCTIFAETTASAQLADTVAAELSHCRDVHVLPLHTGALGPAGSNADTYLSMMRANTETIVEGLAP